MRVAGLKCNFAHAMVFVVSNRTSIACLQLENFVLPGREQQAVVDSGETQKIAVATIDANQRDSNVITNWVLLP